MESLFLLIHIILIWGYIYINSRLISELESDVRELKIRESKLHQIVNFKAKEEDVEKIEI